MSAVPKIATDTIIKLQLMVYSKWDHVIDTLRNGSWLLTNYFNLF